MSRLFTVKTLNDIMDQRMGFEKLEFLRQNDSAYVDMDTDMMQLIQVIFDEKY